MLPGAFHAPLPDEPSVGKEGGSVIVDTMAVFDAVLLGLRAPEPILARKPLDAGRARQVKACSDDVVGFISRLFEWRHVQHRLEFGGQAGSSALGGSEA